MKLFSFLVLSCCMVFSVCSCNRNGAGSVNRPEQQQSRQRKVQFIMTSPKNNDKFVLGTDVVLAIQYKDTISHVDSVRWLVDGKLVGKTTEGMEITWKTLGQTTGTHRIEVIAHYETGQRDMVSASVLLLAAASPKQYTYKIVNTYPHDKSAYTQGLIFEDGFLYESTGLQGVSSLRKVNLITGEPVQVTNLPSEMFGEGLAAVGDKLIQLTWQNQVAFVYQKADFKLLQRINYPMREGWGLTYDGKHLIMTDGSALVYFLDPTSLMEEKRMEVCDHKGVVRELNELEYIDGELWANVYRTDDIVRIDPATGAVLSRIDMKGLLKPSDRHAGIDVLNGIAYDVKTRKIYVTGKNWPKLFEIQVIEKGR